MANVDILKPSGQTAPQVGAVIQTAAVMLTNYIVESCSDGNNDIDSEDMMDSYGLRLARLIFNRTPKITATLQVLTGATPLTDFPKGKMVPTATSSALATYYVSDATVSSVKGVRKLNVTLDAIFSSIAAG